MSISIMKFKNWVTIKKSITTKFYQIGSFKFQNKEQPIILIADTINQGNYFPSKI
jgi:allophanate hydrolase subunit 2